MFGKPVIKGTRITVELILRKIADGMTGEQILEHHPHLTVEDIRAAAAFAAECCDALLVKALRDEGHALCTLRSSLRERTTALCCNYR